MCREWLLVAALASVSIGVSMGLPGCSQPPATQLIVVVDTDYAIPGGIDEIDIDVVAVDGTHHLERQPMASASALPYTLAVVPSTSSLGPIRIEARGLRGGSVVVSRMGRVMLAARQTLMVRLDLLRVCDAMSVMCPGADQTCGDDGSCRAIDLTPTPWTGMAARIADSGVSPDAGGNVDAAISDAGVPHDASAPDGAGDCHMIGCPDDGNPCTDEVCGTSGMCTHPNNSIACDDGLFCNGSDLCGSGSCRIHSGDPCGGASCNEVARHCGSCSVDADCPGSITGGFGACGGFANTCAVDGTQSRTIQTFHCTTGSCVPTPTTDTQACRRASTDGTSCGSTMCGAFGTCTNTMNVCSTAGMQSRTCNDMICSGGACGTSPRTDTATCTRPSQDGVMCMATVCGAWTGACSYVGDCHPTTMQSRSCTDYSCGAGSCVASPPRTEMQRCPMAAAGTNCLDPATNCGVRQCSVTGVCTQIGAACAGTQVCCPPCGPALGC